MKKFYLVKVQMRTENDKGQIKKRTDAYLVEGVSVTDAETIVNAEFANTQLDFTVMGVTETKIVDILSA